MASKIINYNRHKIFIRDINEVSKVLKSNFLTQGKKKNIFQNILKKKIKSKFVTFSNSASSALFISCKSLGLKENDILWTSSNTYAASANCAIMCGASLDLIDISLEDFNICINSLEEKLIKAKKKKKLPKIIVAVHFGGNPCNLKRLFILKKRYGFKIIEDASHALGSKYNNKPIGDCSYSEITIFSFHAIKNITTGEGGAISTNNLKIFNNIELFINNGINKNLISKYDYYDQKFYGSNFRLSDIQLSLGISQLKKLKYFVEYRNKIANIYKKKIITNKINFQKISKNDFSAYHLFPIILINNKIRNKLYNYLRSQKIFCKILYPPLDNQKFFRNKTTKCINSRSYYKRMISLPVHCNLTQKDIIKITNKINYFFNHYAK